MPNETNLLDFINNSIRINLVSFTNISKFEYTNELIHFENFYIVRRKNARKTHDACEW